MNPSLLRTSLIAFALMTASGLCAAKANAESPQLGGAAPRREAGCAVSVPSRMIATMRVPANVLAIPGLDESYFALPTVTVDAVGSVNFDVKPDTFSRTTLLVRPSGELPLGPTKLTFRTACSIQNGPGVGGDKSGEGGITVTDAAELPKTIGTILPGSAPGRFRVGLSKELIAYRSVAAISISATSGTVEVGAFLPASYGNVPATRDVIEVGYAPRAASGDPAGTDAYLVFRPIMDAYSGKQCEGKSGVVSIPIEVKVHVAGAQTDPAPISGSVSVDCDAAEREYKAATPPAAAAGSPSTLGNDYGGCSAAPHGSDDSSRTPLVSFMVVLGAVIAASRRRR